MTDKHKVLLIGLGQMGISYANILKSLNQQSINVGRSISSCEAFEKETGLQAISGGLENYLVDDNKIDSAIIAVSEDQLSNCLDLLINHGVKRILIEKPGGTNYQSIIQSATLASEKNADVFVGYNRRFYQSVRYARELIKEDGGVSSFFFEFTEWSDIVSKLNTPEQIKKLWFLHNSTHVVDLAFFLAGFPDEISCERKGSLPWHPSGSSYSGSGKTQAGALFTYFADWDAPGRWGLEILTKKRRLILRPLEELYCQFRGSVAIEQVEINNSLDLDYKPGLFFQVQSFLEKNEGDLLKLSEQVKYLNIYQMISSE